jgi:hypothetical protein
MMMESFTSFLGRVVGALDGFETPYLSSPLLRSLPTFAAVAVVVVAVAPV